MWEDNVRTVTPYVAGEQPKEDKMIKINTNESPYPPAPGVRKAIEAFKEEDLRLYPDSFAKNLVHELALRYGVKDTQIFVGVGSDDVLAMSYLTFFNSGKPILFSDITYSFYDVWAELYHIPYKLCKLDSNFKMRKEDYYQENGGIIIANPNAPTGVYESPEFIEDIIKANPNVIVIVDEAYIDFGGNSCIPLLSKYDNLLVVQTFSKSRAMAGLRIGFAIGNERMISYLQDVKFSFNSYTMNLPTLVFGVEAVKDEAYLKETTRKVVATREWVKERLKEMGFSFPDSMTNFIFATHKSVPAVDIYNELRKHKIFVRYFNKPGIDNYLRISMGTDEQMETVMKVLKEYLKERQGV